MNIESYLCRGAAAAKSRSRLCAEIGICDRDLRRRIADAREHGVPIVSSSGGAGYYIASTDAERRIAISEYMSRAHKCLKIARRMSRHSLGQLGLEACNE